MGKLLKWLALFVLAIILVAMVAVALNWERFNRLLRVNSLFTEELIVSNFSAMDTMFETTTMPRGDVAATPLTGTRQPLPERFAHDGEIRGLADWMDQNAATAIVVLKDGELVHEDYFRDTGEDDLRISWSVAKSFVSVLLGTVVEAGEIASLDDPVELYVPELTGSAYEGVTVRQVANMASGVTFDEDYLDFNSDINRMGRVLALGGSMDAFAADLTLRDRPAGRAWQYVSIDTHVLAMVIRGATGRSLPELMGERVMQPLGLEADPYFVTDGYGVAFALGGLNLRTRDYARFGLMVEQGGIIEGRRIVSEAWIRESTTPSAPQAPPGGREMHGYGLQWWIPQAAEAGETYAVGIYDQYIFIDPERDVVIALNSANRAFREPGVRDGQIAMMRAIARHYDE
ncbi:serine hydrolase domain-containing protein [Pontivivens insulae]|uniref:6-aminohexanoate-dimer hydrolase n=1 Tax=Pontivivens insulae TaxID=1639689 RepID=A0A2R8AA54_9RHOB|nr:serine hydrolase [Pontivivens insulae]RED13020.1 CubicO group peptidase (beta-lactamase class C family) [Pontivivens insulae]SPF29112.1 6-aminohexanoate-dimer hydrolase [Pontivivens insulae]